MKVLASVICKYWQNWQ